MSLCSSGGLALKVPSMRCRHECAQMDGSPHPIALPGLWTRPQPNGKAKRLFPTT